MAEDGYDADDRHPRVLVEWTAERDAFADGTRMPSVSANAASLVVMRIMPARSDRVLAKHTHLCMSYQWRAILLPVGLAIVSILVLSWYNFVWIPAQQHYLNDRNLRVLRTISAQIKAKVDYFDQAIDHSLDSVANPDRDLAKYVHLFAPDLEVLQFANERVKGAVGKETLPRAGRPPGAFPRCGRADPSQGGAGRPDFR
jgi:hypothetical protein